LVYLERVSDLLVEDTHKTDFEAVEEPGDAETDYDELVPLGEREVIEDLEVGLDGFTFDELFFVLGVRHHILM
jgi:hypothetical protein